jgi:HD-GYP domain-containing protein (c-di-GMP phosphodiesterase class II)
MVRTHHWRPDGRGYPPGLTEADVPVGARVIHVCDAFDAMVSDRPYRKGLPVARALGELKRHAGTQFDADIVAVLVALHGEGRLALDKDAERAEQPEPADAVDLEALAGTELL